jgi:Na+/H+-dicarboxylate symporter
MSIASDTVLRVLGSPWAALSGALAGALMAWRWPRAAEAIAPIGSSYLGLLQLCVLPIFALSVVGSMARLLLHNHLKLATAWKVVACYVASCVVAGIIGVSVGRLAQVGNVTDRQSREELGKRTKPAFGTVRDSTVFLDKGIRASPGSWSAIPITPFVDAQASLDEPMLGDDSGEVGSGDADRDIWRSIEKVVPDNLFAAFANKNYLAVLLIAILCGIALGVSEQPTAQTLVALLDVAYSMFMRILGWLLCILPVGLLCLVAKHVSSLMGGSADLEALLTFIVACAATSLILIAVAFALIAILLPTTVTRAARLVRKPAFVAFCSMSSAAAVPLILERVSEHHKLKGELAHTLVPLGVSLHPFGSVMYFGMGAILIAQLQSIPLTASSYSLLVLGAIAAGMAAGGVPGPGPIVVLGLVLRPLDIPPEVGMAALISINPVIDPFVTALNVMGNFVATVLFARTSTPAAVNEVKLAARL